MTRMIIFLLAILALCFMIGCELGDPISIGAYKRPRDNWDMMQLDKVYGHKGFDIYNPTPEIMKQYCSLCHYIN